MNAIQEHMGAILFSVLYYMYCKMYVFVVCSPLLGNLNTRINNILTITYMFVLVDLNLFHSFFLTLSILMII